MKICGIYRITSPTGRVYIGQSKDVIARWWTYTKMQNQNKNIVRLYRSFLKHGVESHNFVVLEECDVSLLYERERHYQELYDATGKYGMNCILVRTTDKRPIVSEYTRKKMSEAGKRKVMTEDHKMKLLLASKRRIGKPGKKMTPENIQAMIERNNRLGLFKGENNPMYDSKRFGELNPFYGKRHTEETKRKLADGRIGTKASEATKKLLSSQRGGGKNSAAKLVLNIETGIYYDCGRDAWQSTAMNYARTTFTAKLNGGNKYPLSFRYVLFVRTLASAGVIY